MTQVFERTALYAEVWAIPLTKLGEKYGLSDNGIRKICKALAIPLPEVGHWARVASGQVIKRTRLPNHNGQDIFVSYAASRKGLRSEYSTPEDEEWLSERMTFESSFEGLVPTPWAAARWLPSIAPLRQAMAIAVKLYREDLREREKQRTQHAQVSNSGIDWSALAWRYLDEGLLYNPYGVRTCLRVSIHTYRRALAIFNALAKAASLRACNVEVDQGHESVRFRLEEAMFSVAIRERRKVVAPTEGQRAPDEESAIDRRLALVVSRYPGGEFQLVDGRKSLEEQLGEFFPRLYRTVVAARARERENNAAALRQAIAKDEAAELAAQQARREAEHQATIEREQRLHQEAVEWRKAFEIRSYVEAVCSAEADTDLAAWRAWALAVADKLDPLQRVESTFRPSS